MSDGEDDFPGAPTNLEFWSLEIPAGKTVEAKILDVPGMFEIVHVTGCALGEKASGDRHVVKAIVTNPEGKTREVALGTLHRDRTDQFALDFGISSTTGFRHTGKSTVYLNGYLTRSYASEEEFGSEDYDMETDEDEDSDDEAPQAVPISANGVPKGSKGAVADSDSDEEGESESSDDEGEEGESSDEQGESEDDEEGDEYDRRLGAKSFDDASASESEGEGEDDESDDESDNPLDIDPTDKVAFVKYDGVAADGPRAMDVEGDSSEEEEGEDDDEDEDEDEDESDDEGEEESGSEEDESEEQEEAEEWKPAAAAAAAKRPPQQPMTPQVQPKRQKGQDGSKAAPATAPAKVPQAKTAGGPVEHRFLQNIIAELHRSGGSLPLGQLSTKVKRPAEIVPKYKAFLLQHSNVVTVDAKDVVSVAK